MYVKECALALNRSTFRFGHAQGIEWFRFGHVAINSNRILVFNHFFVRPPPSSNCSKHQNVPPGDNPSVVRSDRERNEGWSMYLNPRGPAGGIEPARNWTYHELNERRRHHHQLHHTADAAAVIGDSAKAFFSQQGMVQEPQPTRPVSWSSPPGPVGGGHHQGSRWLDVRGQSGSIIGRYRVGGGLPTGERSKFSFLLSL